MKERQETEEQEAHLFRIEELFTPPLTFNTRLTVRLN